MIGANGFFKTNFMHHKREIKMKLFNEFYLLRVYSQSYLAAVKQNSFCCQAIRI